MIGALVKPEASMLVACVLLLASPVCVCNKEVNSILSRDDDGGTAGGSSASYA